MMDWASCSTCWGKKPICHTGFSPDFPTKGVGSRGETTEETLKGLVHQKMKRQGLMWLSSGWMMEGEVQMPINGTELKERWIQAVLHPKDATASLQPTEDMSCTDLPACQKLLSLFLPWAAGPHDKIARGVNWFVYSKETEWIVVDCFIILSHTPFPIWTT